MPSTESRICPCGAPISTRSVQVLCTPCRRVAKEKICTGCLGVKAFGDFNLTSKQGDGHECQCRGCRNADKREHWHTTESTRRAAATKSRFYNYGLTPEQYDRMLLDRCGRCDKCGKPAPLVVDHCHDSEAVRGLLCHHCNVGIGMLGDTLEGVKEAVRYLEAA